jgi:hypothetical protein
MAVWVVCRKVGAEKEANNDRVASAAARPPKVELRIGVTNHQFYNIAPLSLSTIVALYINATLWEGRETRIATKQCYNLTEICFKHPVPNTTKDYLLRHPTDRRSASGKLPRSSAPMGPSPR